MAYKGFSKAVLSPKDTPGYLEYLEALLKYKEECKKFKKLSLAFKNATAPMERLVYLEAKEKYKIACKVYSNARYTYAAAIARAKTLSTHRVEASEIMEAAARGIAIPMSMAEIVQAEKDSKAKEYWAQNPEEFEKLKAVALAYKAELVQAEQKSESVRVQFLESKDKSDPTLGDFDSI